MNALRALIRAGCLGTALVHDAADYGGRRRRVGTLTATDRAAWLQESATRTLRGMGITVAAQGAPPSGGLLVSNHLGYLDALAYAALLPCVFIAKQEVQDWPVFGRLVSMAGTIYVRRQPRDPNHEAVTAMERALGAGLTVILFPEGTSTDGQSVLRFHSRFFEPAIRLRAPVTAAAIAYTAPGAAEESIAYHGADVLLPHLWRTLGTAGIHARVAFSGSCLYEDRKTTALATQAEVSRLRRLLLEGDRRGAIAAACSA